jgi:hypothetical protein
MPKRPSRLPEPPKPLVWNVKFASKAVWLGAMEAPDEATAMERAAVEFKVAAKEVDGDSAMIRRKGEITRVDLKGKWPHHRRKGAEPQYQ